MEKDIWADDKLNRQETATDFTRLLEHLESPSVVAINAKYGFGKTFFIKRWCRELSANKKAIYFSAWDYDFASNPIIPFTECLLDDLDKKKTAELKNTAKNLTKTLAASAVSLVTLKVVDGEKVIEANNSGADVEIFKQTLENIKAFKETLIEYVKNEGELYIFIDELERCRPTFAVEMLEQVKHIFNVKGVKFILGIDREQLKHTISSIYGSGFDGDGYLRRFIDVDLLLPEPERLQFLEALYEKHELQRFASQGQGFTKSTRFAEFFNTFAEVYGLSLRETEQIFQEVSLVMKMAPKNVYLGFQLVIFLVIIRYKDPTLYNTVVNDSELLTTYEKSFQELDAKIKDDSHKQNIKEIFGIFLSQCDSDALVNRKEKHKQDDNSDKEQLYQFATHYKDRLLQFGFHNGLIQYINKLITYQLK